MDPQPYSKKIKEAFFQREEVLEIAQETVGKFLFTNFDGSLTGGMITEVEAYRGAEDKACHAYGNRRTPRTEVMYRAGGIAYVYLCYGIHYLFNIVTHFEGTPHAILVRAIEPTIGLEKILVRRKKPKLVKDLCSGPGMVTQALGITTAHTGLSLIESTIFLEDHGPQNLKILQTPRIGIDYAEEHKDLPWRFVADKSLNT